MAYAQIAQQKHTFDREDGTTREWQWTFELNGGSAQTYNIPKLKGAVIKKGDRNDAINKPFKTHELSFTVKGKNEPLIDEIANADSKKDIRVTVEDLTAGKVHFEGFVMPDFTDVNLYDDVQVIKVTCFGALNTADKTVGSATSHNFDELAAEIASDISISRELDLYSSLRHKNQSTSVDLPTAIEFNEAEATGENDNILDNTATLFDAVKNVMTALGWQIFQRQGRLVFADLYDRVNNKTSVKKYESDGQGGYTQTTENVEVSIGKSEATKEVEPKTTQLQPVKTVKQQHSQTVRLSSAFTPPLPLTETTGSSTTRTLDFGLVLEGDTIEFDIEGDVRSTDPLNNDVAGESKFLELQLHPFGSSDIYYYDPFNDTWEKNTQKEFSESFNFTTLDGGGQTDPLDQNGITPEAPDGIGVAELKVVTKCELSLTSGSSSDIVGNDFDKLDIRIIYQDSSQDVSLIHQVDAGRSDGETIKGVSFIGDKNIWSDRNAFNYLNPNTSNFEDTFEWISPTGDGTLPDVVADRIADFVVGAGREFRVQIRDTDADVDLLTVFSVLDNSGATVTCLPVEIKHSIENGFVDLWLREVFTADSTSSSMTWTTGIDASGSTTSGTSSNTGGGLSKAQADGFYFEEDKNLSEGDPATMRSNMGVVIGTDVQAHSAVLDDVAANNGAADLVINSLETQGTILSRGDLTVGQQGAQADLHIYGDIFQHGDAYETHAEQLYTEKDFIIQREGVTGGLAAGEIAGSKIIKADGTNNVVFGTDNSAIARVGWEGGTLQAIATRQDSPDADGVPFWNGSQDRFDTASDLTFDGTILSAPNLRTDTGKFLSPNSYQFRNAGDTAFRDVEMAGLTATTATFTSTVNADRVVISPNGFDVSGDSVFNDDIAMLNSGDQVFKIQRSDGAYGFRIFRDSTAGEFRFQVGQDASSTSWHTIFDLGEATTSFDIQPNGGETTIGGELSVNKTTSPAEALDVNGNVSTSGAADSIVSNGFYSEGTSKFATVEIDTLRTTLFKPNSVSGMGGEFIFNGTSKVVSIDTGANTIVMEDPSFSSGDAVVVSSMVGDTGFSKTWLDITSNGTSVTGGTEYSYSVNASSPGTEGDIEQGYTAVKVNGNVIYVNANETDADHSNMPFMEGYNSVSGFDLIDGTATPNWYIRNNEISVGSVFSADGNADTGTLAGANFDTSGIWSANNSNTFKGTGLYIDWSDEDFSLSDRFWYDKSEDLVRIAGAFSDDRYIWGNLSGHQSNTDPTALDKIGYRFDNQTGQIYSDAIRRRLYNAVATAGSQAGDEASAPDSDRWVMKESAGGTNTNQHEEIKVWIPYRKEFSERRISAKGAIKQTQNFDGSASDTSEVRLYCDGTKIATKSINTSGSYITFDIIGDIPSGLSLGAESKVEVRLYVQVDSSSGTINETTLTMREDLIIDAMN